MRLLAGVLPVLFFLPFLLADGPTDNMIDKVRPVPPKGVVLEVKDRKDLEEGVAELGKEIEGLKTSLKSNPKLLDLLPDVEIYYNAVRFAVKHDEFYNLKEVPVAKAQLKTGRERAAALKEGKAPWTTQTGPVVRGYRSKLDDTVQPYGLVVPESWKPGTEKLHRLDFWCHGRGENLTELSFIQQRQGSKGEFVPPDAFVLHLYGRYCCANKLAGEVDCFEALENARKHYPIDMNRLVMRGFSMGGAAAWQFAAHFPSMWCAAAPGAGFSETPDFLKVFQKEIVQPTWYEKKLFHMYDCTDYAVNFFNLPTVAYSGENDSQKQAADIMATAMKKEGMDLVHIIGPKTGHSYHPEAKKEINAKIDAIAAEGKPALPEHVKFTTYMLRYNRSHWVQIDGMKEQWEEARIEARLIGKTTIKVTTKGVTAFTLFPDKGSWPIPLLSPSVEVDGKILLTAKYQGKPWHFRKAEQWEIVPTTEQAGLHKVHDLQGPIDDAFLSRFLFVKPDGKSPNPKVAAFVSREMDHAIDHWRKQFRGEVRIKSPQEVTEQDIAESNLILWGDAESNSFLKGIAEKLPIPVSSVKETAVPVFIYPNPLNPKKYVVLNSGFTFREYDYLNNARQIPKLPDWALIDATTPMSSRGPGKVTDAGFFDEEWKLKKKQ